MKEDHQTYVIRAVLRETDPPIWRRVIVPVDVKLLRFHTVLQKSFGWTNSHLHEFVREGVSFQPVDPDGNQDYVPYERMRMDALFEKEGDRADYRYDFGDGWEHQLTLEKILPAGVGPERPACLGGARACPPEDCGGTSGYERLVDAMRDQGHPEREEFIEWLGRPFDSEAFDLERVNRRLGWPSGQVLGIPSGLDLTTPLGRLPSLIFEEDAKDLFKSMLRELDRPATRVPKEILEECSEMRVELAPAFLEALETPERLLAMARGEHELPFYMIYLLAEYREKKAHGPLIRMFSLIGDEEADIFGDIIPRDFPRILASTFGGDLEPIRSLVANPKAHPWVRGAALETHAYLAAHGLIQPLGTLDYLRGLLREGFDDPTGHLWRSWVECTISLHPQELSKEILALFEDGRVGYLAAEKEHVAELLRNPSELSVWGKPPEEFYRLVDDTAKAVAWWPWFKEDETPEGPVSGEDDLFGESPFQPFARQGPKVGRNDPCPCGSGKKYKKCCGA